MSLSIEILTPTKVDAVYIKVDAGVRYWEDAKVNGIEDSNGTLIPFRNGDSWSPTIRLTDGFVDGWPAGTEAEIHYKVCDAGHYWLLDADKNRIAKWSDYYVPNDLLCVGSNGYGDYIIMSIGLIGFIKDWKQPSLNCEDWEPVA